MVPARTAARLGLAHRRVEELVLVAKAQWRWVRRGVRRMVRGARTWSTPFGEHPGDHVRVERAADDGRGAARVPPGPAAPRSTPGRGARPVTNFCRSLGVRPPQCPDKLGSVAPQSTRSNVT
jgi:hypothetical protein